MALDPNINTLEKEKFRESSDGKAAVAVVSIGDSGGLISGVRYDDIVIEYPTATTESYLYYLESSQVATVSVEYNDSTKKQLVRARRLS